jgi:hypothetical protein
MSQHLPADILFIVCNYSKVKEIVALRQVNRAFRAWIGNFTQVHLDFTGLFPSSLQFFEALTQFQNVCSITADIVDQPTEKLNLNQLFSATPKLQHLDIDYNCGKYAVHENDNGLLWPMTLQSLKVSSLVRFGVSNPIPLHLTKLDYTDYHLSQDLWELLPQSLTSLRAILTETRDLKFPPSLISLDLQYDEYGEFGCFPNFVKSLPKSLTSLTLYMFQFELDDFQHLPPGLTYLKMNHGIPPWIARMLPRSLKVLDVLVDYDHNPPVDSHELPSNLKILNIARYHDRGEKRTLPLTLTELKLSECLPAISDLFNLTSLCFESHGFDIPRHFAQTLPKQLKHLEMSRKYCPPISLLLPDIENLPPTLETLFLHRVNLPTGSCSLLSKQLNCLKLIHSAVYLNDRDFEMLPPSITHLEIVGTTQTTLNLMSLLPPILKILVLQLYQNENNGNNDSSLPGPHVQWSSCDPLPRTLTSLTLGSARFNVALASSIPKQLKYLKIITPKMNIEELLSVPHTLKLDVPSAFQFVEDIPTDCQFVHVIFSKNWYAIRAHLLEHRACSQKRTCQLLKNTQLSVHATK